MKSESVGNNKRHQKPGFDHKLKNSLQAKKTRRKRQEKEEAISEATKEETKRLNAEIPKTLHNKLKMFAASRETKITNVVIEALNEYLSKNAECAVRQAPEFNSGEPDRSNE